MDENEYMRRGRRVADYYGCRNPIEKPDGHFREATIEEAHDQAIEEDVGR